MRAMEVAVMEPEFEFFSAFEGVLAAAGVGPFSECGLDESFGVVAGARGLGPREAVLEVGLQERAVGKWPSR